MSLVRIAVLFSVSLLAWGGSSLGSSSGAIAFNSPNLAANASWRIEFQIHGLTSRAFNDALDDNGPGLQIDVLGDSTLQLRDVRDAGAALCRLKLGANGTVRAMRNSTARIFSAEYWNVDGGGYQQCSAKFTPQNWTASDGGIAGNVPFALGFYRVCTDALPGLHTRPPTTADGCAYTELKFDGNLRDSSRFGHHASGSASYVPTPGQTAYAKLITKGAPFWTNWTALRAGHPNQLDASQSFSMADTSSSVRYSLTSMAWPTNGITPLIKNGADAMPVVEGLIFGTYTFREVVTDSAGNVSAPTNLTAGAVATDDNWVVIPAKESLARVFFGPQIAFGHNPWPYQDASNANAIEQFGSQLGEPGSGLIFDPDWQIPAAGTVSINGPTVTGDGTAFQDLFCGGSGKTNPAGGYYLVLWYQDPKTPGRVGAWPMGIAANGCASQMLLREDTSNYGPFPYAGVSCTVRSPCKFSRSKNYPALISGTGSWGYYDMAAAYYAAWQRSGFEPWRNYGRKLNARTITGPGIDEGVQYIVPPRANPTLQWAIEVALDDKAGDATFVRAIRNVASRYGPLFSNGFPFSNGAFGAHTLGDARETGAEYLDVAAAALVETDPVLKAQQVQWIEDGYTKVWAPQVQGDGHWLAPYAASWSPLGPTVNMMAGSPIVTTAANFPAGYCGTETTRSGTIAVTQGGTSVTGTGTNFSGSVGQYIFIFGKLNGTYYKQLAIISAVTDSSHLTVDRIIRAESGSGLNFKIISSGANRGAPSYIPMGFVEVDAQGNTTANQFNDPLWYTCTYNSPTQVTLDQPFDGRTGPHKGYVNEYSLNQGLQPYYLGFVSAGLAVAAAVGSPHSHEMASLAHGFYPYFSKTAYVPATKGVAYARGFASCEPFFFDTFNCGGDIQSTRMYGVELIRGLAEAYLASPSPEKRSFLDQVYGAQWGNDAVFGLSPSSDGSYVTDCGIGFLTARSNDKYLGQCFGLGSTASWPAARLGGVMPLKNVTYEKKFDLSAYPGASQVTMVVTAPSGEVSSFKCSSSPCSLTLDGRQGDYLIQVQYANAANGVVAITNREKLILAP